MQGLIYMTILDTMHHDTHTPHQAMIGYGRARLTPPRFALRADEPHQAMIGYGRARRTPPRFALRADEPHPAMIDYGRARLTPPRFALHGDAEQLITHTTLQIPCRLEATCARGSLRRVLPYAVMLSSSLHTPHCRHPADSWLRARAAHSAALCPMR